MPGDTLCLPNLPVGGRQAGLEGEAGELLVESDSSYFYCFPGGILAFHFSRQDWANAASLAFGGFQERRSHTVTASPCPPITMSPFWSLSLWSEPRSNPEPSCCISGRVPSARVGWQRVAATCQGDWLCVPPTSL